MKPGRLGIGSLLAPVDVALVGVGANVNTAAPARPRRFVPEKDHR